MKQKMPLTPTTPVPTPSAAIAADANREGPSTVDDGLVPGGDEAEPSAVAGPEGRQTASPQLASDSGRTRFALRSVPSSSARPLSLPD